MSDTTGIHLTPTERRIFDLLRQYPNVKISSHRLAREGRLKNPNTLNNYIFSIRQKLQAAEISDTIVSVPRVGYMLSTMEVKQEEEP